MKSTLSSLEGNVLRLLFHEFFSSRTYLNSTLICALKISSNTNFFASDAYVYTLSFNGLPIFSIFSSFSYVFVFVYVALLSAVRLMQDFCMLLVCFLAKLYFILQAYFLLRSEVRSQTADNARFLSMLNIVVV